MTERLQEQLQELSDHRSQLKDDCQVVIFGPYSGDCKYILKDVASILRKDHNISADICMELPDSSALLRLSNSHSDVYNFQSSIECINRADYAVFAFLEARQMRFEKFGPFKEELIEMYDRPQYVPQDLNASNAIEFEKWIDNGMPNPERCTVIYENDVKKALGSIIRGIVRTGEVTSYPVETTRRGDTVQTIVSTIRGEFESWISKNQSIFR